MKSIVVIAFCLLALNSFAAVLCSQPEADLLALATNRFNSGLVTAPDVQLAKMNLLQAQLGCGEISKQVYCLAMVPQAQDYVQIMTARYSTGIAEFSEVIGAQKQLRDAQDFCK